MTELHYAAYCQDLAGVKDCLERGFDINQKDVFGGNALIWCIDMAATGRVGEAEAVVDYLIEHGGQLEYEESAYGNIIEFAKSRDDAVANHLEKLLQRDKESAADFTVTQRSEEGREEVALNSGQKTKSL